MGSGSTAFRCGIAGWDYPDWRGPVYPAVARSSFDPLAWISRFVDVIEINSSFYRPCVVATARRWLERSHGERGPTFTAKAHRSLTHDATVPESVESTVEGLRPLLDAGRLAALLLQFPQRFHASAAAIDRLSTLAEALRDFPVVVEVRHRSWRSAEAFDGLCALGIGWCVVDQPRVPLSTIDPMPRVSGSLAYLRMHGRNVRSWFSQDVDRDTRYDYLYTPPEIDELADLARCLSRRAESVVVVQNNHFRGQALVNALQLRSKLSGERVEAPASLIEAYPVLADVAIPVRAALF